ncbi:MAG: recombination regulator RecX [Bordetella sp.]|uniref:recombination regulator RecX n=1 Tax=Bordetella sp. TaxID=28081 RepID=UPI003F7C2BC8
MPIPPKNKPRRAVVGGAPADDGGFETVVPCSRVSSVPASSDTEADNSADVSAGTAAQAPRRGLSLKARAVGYLSRREYARDELARKLRPYTEDPAEIDAVLDALQREGWQSNERFAASLVHRRAPLRGAARILQELRQHGVDDAVVAEAGARLKATEHERAQAVWSKRYSVKPADRNDYARQARFLASRGFSQEVIHRVLGQGDEDE